MTQPVPVQSIHFSLNGEAISAACRADRTVLEYLRSDALLRGSKEGCAEGDCGACSVLVKRAGSERFQAANSCIMLMGQVDGGALVTVEGLASMGDDGHAVQQRMAENGSSQCGFCTPGIVCALAGLASNNDEPADADIHEALAGNLCRCTGYRPIVEAAAKAAREARGQLPEVKVAEARLVVGADDSRMHAPDSLTDLLNLLAAYPDAVLLAGGTDSALAVAQARERWPRIISTAHVEELCGVSEKDGNLVIGGSESWGAVLPHLDQYWPSFAKLVRRFGSVQIRTMGTIAGNLATASPIGDGAPSLIALGASVQLASCSGERSVPLDTFFSDYRQSVLGVGEVIKSITVPLPIENQVFRVYKVSKRYDQDISTVCGAFNLMLDGDVIKNAMVAYGGMAATPVRLRNVEDTLKGRVLDNETVRLAREALQASFTPMSDMRGSARYRLMAAVNLMDRLAADLSGQTVEVMDL